MKENQGKHLAKAQYNLLCNMSENYKKKVRFLFIGCLITLMYAIKNPIFAGESKILAVSGYLRVIQGSGEVTQSDYPQYIPPSSSQTRKKVTAGAYDPSRKKLILEVEARQIELSLNSPLKDNSNIDFSVSKIIRNQNAPLLVRYLDPRLWIDNNFQTKGVLKKKGSRISGEFITQGGFLIGNGRISSRAKIKGKFTLLLSNGKPSNLPNSYQCYRTLTPKDSSSHYCP